MANHARNQGPRAVLDDRAPRQETIYEYEIPDDEDDLHKETTASFGSIRKIGLRLLTPLQEKSAAQACKGDALLLAFELAKRSIAQITNDRDETIGVAMHNKETGTDELWAQMHPKIRTLVVQAYSDMAVPADKASLSFLASRKIKA